MPTIISETYQIVFSNYDLTTYICYTVIITISLKVIKTIIK